MSTTVYQPEPVTPSDSAALSEIHQRIQDLTPRLIAYSSFIESPEMDQDDVFQEEVLALLERAAKSPEFANQKDAYLLRFATWMAKHAAERTYTYDNRIYHLNAPLDFSDHGCYEDGGHDRSDENFVYQHMVSQDFFDCYNGPTDPAEIVEHEQDLDELLEKIQGLSHENQTVVRMIYLGYSESEIASALHISRPAVTSRKHTIANSIGV